MKGIILKNQNGYFSIAGEGEQLTLCRSRGKLKRKTDILVGDAVEYETGLGSEGVITKVYPRKNALHRPPVAICIRRDVDLARDIPARADH